MPITASFLQKRSVAATLAQNPEIAENEGCGPIAYPSQNSRRIFQELPTFTCHRLIAFTHLAARLVFPILVFIVVKDFS